MEDSRARIDEFAESQEDMQLGTDATYKALFDHAPDGYIVTDSEGLIQDANAAAARLFGKNVRGLQGQSLLDFIPEIALKDLALADFAHTWKWEGEVRPEGPVKSKPFWAALSSSILRDKAGRISCLGWLIRDLSERKHTEDALRQSEGLLRMFIDHAPAALAMFDREMVCIAVNPKWLNDLRVKKSDVLGRNHYDVFPQIPQRWRDAHRRALEGEVVLSEGEDSFRLADGSLIWTEWEVRPWYDAAGQVAGIVIYSNDITERKKTETALRESEARLTLAINAAKAGTWEWEIDTRTTTWSPEMFRLIGLDPGRTEASYEAWLDTIDPADRPIVKTTIENAVRSNADLNLEWRVDQSDRWLMSRGKPFLDESGMAVRYYGIVLDITERKQMEIQLRQSRADLEVRVGERTRELSQTIRTLNERSEQLRQMTAELTLVEQRERQRLAQVLHDGLQQILVGAKYRLALASPRNHDLNPNLDQVIELIDDAIETSRSLSAELSPPILINGNLLSALKWLARWMQNKYKLKVSVVCREEVPTLPDEVLLLLFQAARELLFNIVKHAGVDSARIELNRNNGIMVMQIGDEGRGFDPSQLRGEGGQTGGTGLFGVSERLTYLGGHLEIDSSPGHGSRFKLTLPLSGPCAISNLADSEKQAQIPVPSSQKADTGKGHGKKKIRVMLADDHMVVRQGLAGLIRGETDFEVAGEASDGESAVKLAREIWPDVILMDISMPGMDGIQAARIIHKDLPQICIIGLSMFQDDEQKGAMCEAGAVKYLTKSAPSEGLIEAIRSCVQERQGTPQELFS